MSEKIIIYLRAMEKRDIPKISAWLSNPDYYQNHLTTYPYDNKRLLKNQLLKEIALGRMIESRTCLLVAEANNEILTGFISLQNLDRRNRHAVLQIYIPNEFRGTDLGLIIASQVYNYIFKDLNLNKIYTYVAGTDEKQLSRYKASKQEPEAILYNYLGHEKQKEDLYIFGTFKKNVIKQ